MNRNLNAQNAILIVLGGLVAYATMFAIQNKSNIAKATVAGVKKLKKRA